MEMLQMYARLFLPFLFFFSSLRVLGVIIVQILQVTVWDKFNQTESGDKFKYS